MGILRMNMSHTNPQVISTACYPFAARRIHSLDLP
jgi:hypothetical protein